jgi:hypothetical protein
VLRQFSDSPSRPKLFQVLIQTKRCTVLGDGAMTLYLKTGKLLKKGGHPGLKESFALSVQLKASQARQIFSD